MQVHHKISETITAQRPSPVVVLERLVPNGLWEIVSTSATGYIRDTTDHEESSNTIFYRDINPVSGVSYRLVHRQDTTNGAVVDVTLGQFDLVATTNS